jgi:ABC-type branched-subunit amino acid transport system substrate-binding protein
LKQRVEVGLLYSRSGGYVLLSNACRDGALAAIEDINADPASPIEIIAVERDPQGNIDRYAPLCEDILTNSSARHVVGCITSWSRKEAIPVVEKHSGTLWYTCPYEGFEANDRVVYTHACPNQHLVPLIGWVARRHGPNGFLLGSNYIWGWETNRVARDLIADAGGEVLGERYLALGDTDVARLIDEIRATRPSFILNNLIGPSSYAFLEAYAALGREDRFFTPESCPLLSCNLTEAELPALNGVADGHLVVGPYFRKAAEANGWPLAGKRRCASSFEAAAYTAVAILADVLATAHGSRQADLQAAFSGRRFASPYGTVSVDPRTQHMALPVVIGRIAGPDVEALEITPSVAPDPYLSRYDRTLTFGRQTLRVVS